MNVFATEKKTKLHRIKIVLFLTYHIWCYGEYFITEYVIMRTNIHVLLCIAFCSVLGYRHIEGNDGSRTMVLNEFGQLALCVLCKLHANKCYRVNRCLKLVKGL